MNNPSYDASSTRRFSRTVAHYVRYRPGYPEALLDFLAEERGLLPGQVIADVGAGPGKLTVLLLRSGNVVYAVEPNADMRAAAEALLGDRPNFRSIAGKAEATGLPEGSVDLVTAAQAFHWFDREAFRRECERILRPGGRVVLLWNDRLDDRSAFLQAYEAFLCRYSTDYEKIDLRRIDERHFDAFYGAGRYRERRFEHYQSFDFEGLQGRYLSCSYALPPTHAAYDEAIEALRRLFDDHREGGVVRMWYRTRVYSGSVGAT